MYGYKKKKMFINLVCLLIFVSWFYITKHYTIIYNNVDYTYYCIIPIALVVMGLYLLQKNINSAAKYKDFNLVSIVHSIYSVIGLYVIINVAPIYLRKR